VVLSGPRSDSEAWVCRESVNQSVRFGRCPYPRILWCASHFTDYSSIVWDQWVDSNREEYIKIMELDDRVRCRFIVAGF